MRLWRPQCLRLLAGAATLALALAAGGCSFSYQLGSLFGKDEDKAEHTASAASSQTSEPAELPPDGDLAYARAAVSEVLAKGSATTSRPWENPRTGARGTVTPIAAAYNQDGFVCRDFLASYVRDGNESWLQGEACRLQGRWEVRSMKPWKRT